MSKRLTIFLVIILHVSLLSGCVAINKKAGSDDQIAKANVDLATEYFRKNQLNYALENLKKALDHNPRSIDGNALMALVYERLDQPERAEVFFKKAEFLVASDTSNYSYIHNIYGTFLCKNGRAEEAEKHFERALNNKLNQNPEVVMENAGFCEFQRQEYGKAEAYYREALKLSPTAPGVLFKMAKLQFDTEKYLSARAYIQRYHEINNSPESLALAIAIERALNAESEAIKLIEQLRKLFPNSKQAQLY